MKLNTKIVNELYSQNLLDKQFFENVLSEKNLPHTLYRDCAVGFPWGEWDKTAQLIASLAYKLSFFDGFEFKKDRHQVFNFFYFFPEKATQYINDLWNELVNLDINSFILTISIEAVTQKIIDNINLNLKILNQANISEEKIIYILFSAQRFHLLETGKEISIVNYLLDNNIIRNGALVKLLKTRVSNISIDKSAVKHESLNKKLRCALIVAGQFREPLRDIDSVVAKISEKDNLEIREIFVSSWKKIGSYNFIPDKFIRHLSSAVLNQIKEGKVSLQEIIDKVEHRDFELSDKLCTSDIPCKVVLNNEIIYPYNKMSNPEKMYFNNALWMQTLGKNYFTERFDIIIKVRPDLELHNFVLPENFLNTVYAEEGWIFRRWGFGMGDQILLGSTEDMFELLTCHGKDNICDIVRLLYHSQEKYRGHINIGILAWSLGLEVNNIPNLQKILKQLPNIDEKFLEKIE